MRSRILLIAPEDGFRHKVAGRLADAGLVVVTETDPDEAVRFLADKGANVVLFTASGTRDKDIALLHRLRNAAPSAAIIVLETGSNVDFAMQARQSGVFDEVLMPFEFSELLTKIEAAVAHVTRQGK